MLKGTVYIYIGEGLLFISLCNENCDINILMEEFPKHGLTDLQKKKNFHLISDVISIKQTDQNA